MLSRSLLSVRRLTAVLIAGVVLLAAASTARADAMTFTGSQSSTTSSGTSVAQVNGTVDVTATTTSAVIKFSLTNNASGPAATYGYITGFGFNLPNTVSVATLKTGTGTSSDPDFKLLNYANGGVQTSLQAGSFDYAFSTSSTVLHTVTGPEILKGIAPGETTTFVLTVTGSGLSGLTAAQVIQDTSVAAGGAAPFSVRFRSTNPTAYQGLKNPDGDKVPVTPVPPKPGVVPAPPGAVLAGLGMGCMILGRFRLRRATPPRA